MNLLDHMAEPTRRVLLGLAVRVAYLGDETILAEGSDRQAIFIVRSGTVRVEKAHLGTALLIDELDEGEVFGEMSFIQRSKASASIVADGDVEIDVIERQRLDHLLSDSIFAAEFYRSIAATLAERLRFTTERAAAATYSWG